MLDLKPKFYPLLHHYRGTPFKNTFWRMKNSSGGGVWGSVECADQKSLVDNRELQNKEMPSCNKTSKVAF